MRKIEGFITDKKVGEGYIVLDTYGHLGFWYSSDIHSGTLVKLYLKKIPSFEKVYDSFMSFRFFGLKFNKQQDMCLSLLFNPFFDEFYKRIKQDIRNIPRNRLRYLVRHFLTPLAEEGALIVKNDLGGDIFLKGWYLQNDICNRCKELLTLIESEK